jgi:hypothetical protein
VVATGHGKAEPGPIHDAGRQGDLKRLHLKPDAAALTFTAGLGPGLAAAPAATARGAYRHVERERRALAGLLPRDAEDRPERRGALIRLECTANPLDGRLHRREVDPHLVGEEPTVVPFVGFLHGHVIAAGGSDGARTHENCCYDRGRYREKSMAAKECPMCGETMQLRQRRVTDHIPGTPQTATARFHEWVCPECDYFEEVDDDGS